MFTLEHTTELLELSSSTFVLFLREGDRLEPLRFQFSADVALDALEWVAEIKLAVQDTLRRFLETAPAADGATPFFSVKSGIVFLRLDESTPVLYVKSGEQIESVNLRGLSVSNTSHACFGFSVGDHTFLTPDAATRTLWTQLISEAAKREIPAPEKPATQSAENRPSAAVIPRPGQDLTTQINSGTQVQVGSATQTGYVPSYLRSHSNAPGDRIGGCEHCAELESQIETMRSQWQELFEKCQSLIREKHVLLQEKEALKSEITESKQQAAEARQATIGLLQRAQRVLEPGTDDSQEWLDVMRMFDPPRPILETTPSATTRDSIERMRQEYEDLLENTNQMIRLERARAETAIALRHQNGSQ
eukprot:TRINITY_DN7133_c0_g1_i1.p1 TRINITY_DN7133_c0_g1~~TRINITY_DN7133_c0_g1_i1.p1  ORF type:complete len:422 (-),score=58.08 TRINITY_DN7133_c0_g1_i1:20-1105(-)